MEILITYQSLIGAIVGGLITYFIFWRQRIFSEKKNKYERRFWIYKALLSNFPQIVCIEFVSAFNMILVEFEKDKEVLDARNSFLKTVDFIPNKEENEDIKRKREEDRKDALIRLINIIGIRINVKVDQLDIQNRIYWPQGFNDTSFKQQELLNLLIKTLGAQDKIYKLLIDKKLSIGIHQGSPMVSDDINNKI